MADALKDLLGKRVSDVEKPKPFPVGNYSWLIQKHEIVESSQKKTPGVQFELQMVNAMEDVDQDLLALVKEPHKRKQRLTFWITEDSLWRLTEFLGILGLDTEGEQTLEELIPETTGQTFIGQIIHEPIQDSDEVRAVIKDNTLQKDE